MTVDGSVTMNPPGALKFSLERALKDRSASGRARMGTEKTVTTVTTVTPVTFPQESGGLAVTIR